MKTHAARPRVSPSVIAVHRGLTASILLLLFTVAAYGATVTVTSAGDTVAVDGGVTLRAAITSINGGANTNADVVASGVYGVNDTINFNIPGAGVHTIAPTTALPKIVKPVTINGYSQPGTSANTLAVGDNAVLLIELSGASAGSGVIGLEIRGGNSTVQGLVINRFSAGEGILSSLSGGNTIAGNFVGTNPTGMSASGVGIAANGTGVLVDDSGTNVIGGTTPGARNVLSGNRFGGLFIPSSANLVQGNYIGIDAAGTAAVPNGNGVNISGFNNTIGGTTASARNVISGNGANGGIMLTGVSATGNLIRGNFIGVNAVGSAAVPNTAAGIFLVTVSGNTVGGTAAGTGNIISGNGSSGLDIRTNSNANVVQGNSIGTDVTGTVGLPNGNDGVFIFGGSSNNSIGGTVAGAGNRIAFNIQDGVLVFDTSTGNAILSNSTFSNTGLGIDFDGSGVVPNDAQDPDTGPNNLQNYPVLSSAVSGSGSTTIGGTLNSTPSSSFRVEFFSNAVCDGSGFGEGEVFLGFSNVTTDGAGNAPLNPTFAAGVTPGRFITATATDSANNTSEFSQCFVVSAAVKTATTTSLLSSQNPATTGQTVTFTATVVPSGAGTPTGSVTFLDGVTSLATIAINASGVATFATSALALGPHTITATYGGDPSFNGSTSPAVVEVINSSAAIPTLSDFGMIALGLFLAFMGAFVLRSQT